MSINNCVNCGSAIPDGATFCPECGHPVEVSPGASGQKPVPPSIGDSFEAVRQSKVFAVSGNLINLLDDSAFIRKPLLWLHIFFACLNVLVPVYILFMLINSGILNTVGMTILLLWLIIALAGWMGFQLWWNRKDKIGRYYHNGDEFYAIPLFSHLIQTIGEWLGIMIGIIGTGAALTAFIFSNSDGLNSLPMNLPIPQFGIAGLIICPVLGFVIILFAKVLAELYRALASIANNTKAMSGRK